MMKTLFVLVDEWNEQDSYSAQVVGVTDKKEWAHAYGEIDAFRQEPEANTIEIMTLNMLDGKLLARIEEWLDHERNPLCTCGHRKLHHRSKGKPQNGQVAHVGNCKHNNSYGGKKSDRYHMCRGFQMAAAQPLIKFEQPQSKIVTAAGLANG